MITFNVIDPRGQVHYEGLETKDHALWAATVCLERFCCGTMSIEQVDADGHILEQFNILRNGEHYIPQVVTIQHH